MSFDAAFFEAFHEEAAEIRSHLPDGLRVLITERPIQDEPFTRPPAPVISIRTQSRIPPDWASLLRGIITRSTGYDHITRYRRETGVPVPAAYLPLYCARAVAEHALMLWTALLRRLPAQLNAFRRFDRNGLTGRELRGRSLAVFGVGNIGREVASIARALGMRVLGVDIAPNAEGVHFVTPDEALSSADVLVCAMSLTPRNHGYFDDNAWSRVRPGAVFVNVSRGELSPFGPLRRALEAGQLAGIGLDVFNEESALAGHLRGGPPSGSRELRDFLAIRDDPRVLCTPHNAFNTTEAVLRKAAQSAAQLVCFLQTGRFTTPVPDESGPA